jgi:nucleoside-diphosphate-sugar epimerase
MTFNLNNEDCWANRSVLITGATGFIGANLVRKLIDLGAKVNVLIRPSSSIWRLNDCLQQINILRGDLNSFKDLAYAVEASNPDVIFHLATARGNGDHTSFNYIQTSIMGAAHLIECMRQSACKRLIVTGGSTEYAPSVSAIAETHALMPVTLHGAVKASASLLYHQASYAEGLEISQLRLFHVYGPWESGHRFLPQAIKLVRLGKPVPLVTGLSRRDWIHVDDVVRAMIIAALPESVTGIFNIGSGKEHTNNEVLDTLESIFNRHIDRVLDNIPKRPTDSEHRYADNSKALAQLGWAPRYGLLQGIQNTLDWIGRYPNAWESEHDSAPVVY